MKLYKTPQFDRWARKSDLKDDDLCNAAQEMAEGLYEADLGSSLFKKRIARSGQGKRGSFRTLSASNRKNRWVFLYGFAKNERSNISNKEQEALKEFAADLLVLTPQEFEKSKLNNKLTEVDCDEEN